MGHPFKHFALVCRHRHHVIANASHCGIFFQSLRHDLTKFGYTEFHYSQRYYCGNHSPVYEERVRHGYFSLICQHHTKRNKHHWEYWVDFFAGRIIERTMPWNWAMEYICDTLSASYCYNPKGFKQDTPLRYFEKFNSFYYMTDWTREFIHWGLQRYAEMGFAGLKKKDTKKKFEELGKQYPLTQVVEALRPFGQLPPLVSDI